MTRRAFAGLEPAVGLTKVELPVPTCRVAMLQAAATSFLTDEQCLERLRGWITARLQGSGHEEILASVVVAANELCSNAVRHTASGDPGGSFTVILTWDNTALRVAVGDQGGDSEPEIGEPELESESGRGLLVAAALADHLDWRPTMFGFEVACDFYYRTGTDAGEPP